MWNETHIHFKTEGCTHCEEALNACSWVMLLGGHGGDGDAEEREEREGNLTMWVGAFRVNSKSASAGGLPSPGTV